MDVFDKSESEKAIEIAREVLRFVQDRLGDV